MHFALLAWLLARSVYGFKITLTDYYFWEGKHFTPTLHLNVWTFWIRYRVCSLRSRHNYLPPTTPASPARARAIA